MSVSVDVNVSGSGDVSVNVNVDTGCGSSGSVCGGSYIDTTSEDYECGCPVSISRYKFWTAIKSTILLTGISTVGVASLGVAIATLPVVASCIGATIFIGGSAMGAFTSYDGGCDCGDEIIDTQLVDSSGAVNKQLLLEMEKTNTGLKALESAYEKMNTIQDKLISQGKENAKLSNTINTIERAYIAREQSKENDTVDTTVYAKQLALV